MKSRFVLELLFFVCGPFGHSTSIITSSDLTASMTFRARDCRAALPALPVRPSRQEKKQEGTRAEHTDFRLPGPCPQPLPRSLVPCFPRSLRGR
ncbi:hypothetical protein Mapa_010014 [Marchantia paleacea]|nr:hypothetical protein Mapa_010014 [Marchantia paleacea]